MKHANAIKIIVAGEGGVGKTSLIQRYVYNEFADTKMTIGVSFASKDVTIGNQPFKLSLWDFAGETNFRFVLGRFCVGASGAILVFDLTRLVSLYALPEWMELIKKGAGSIPMVLVGNKSDLVQDGDSQNIKSEIDDLKEDFGIREYFETSAKDDVNVDQVFQSILKYLKEFPKPPSLA